MKKASRMMGILSIASIALSLASIIVMGIANSADPSFDSNNMDTYGWWVTPLAAIGFILFFASIIFLILYIVYRIKLSKHSKKYANVEKVDINAAEIKKYHELLEKGIISQEEFEAKKKKILDI